MLHAHTLALAAAVLAEGRAPDVVQMLTPLIKPGAPHTAEDAQGRCLLARAHLVHQGRADEAHRLLAPLETATDPAWSPAVRGQVALWLGWTYAWPRDGMHDLARATSWLHRAQSLLTAEADSSGRAWATLGLAWTYLQREDDPAMATYLLQKPLVREVAARRPLARQWAALLRLYVAVARGTRTAPAEDEALRGAPDLVQALAALSRAALAHRMGTPLSALHASVHEAIQTLTALVPSPAEALWAPPSPLAPFVGAVLRGADALDVPPLPQPASPALLPSDLVGLSPAMQSVRAAMGAISQSALPVLLQGEPGSGLRWMAHALHAMGPQAEGPVVCVRCEESAITPAEERLFGHGAAPSALAEARGGTLVLDHAETLPLEIQRRLLHHLRASSPSMRVVTTMHPDPARLADEGRLLPALLDHLGALRLTLPPLRERRDDLPLLVHHFLHQQAPGGTPLAGVTVPAWRALLAYPWPGNVRQLHHELERALIYASSEPTFVLDVASLSADIQAAATMPDRTAVNGTTTVNGTALAGHGFDRMAATYAPAASSDDGLLDAFVTEAERALISHTLKKVDGQVSAAADQLGLTRQGLYKKMKRIGLSADQFQRPAPDASPSYSLS
ncbi:MAG: sigma 54-interacting transcriptional regulator [Bacteroidota bacterium]